MMKKKLFMLLMMVFMLCNQCLPAYADSIKVNKIYHEDYAYLTYRPGVGFYVYDQAYLDVDGVPAYCIEPLATDINNDVADYQKAKIEEFNEIPKSTKQLMSLIAYFGYQYPGHQHLDYYYAAQQWIWELLGTTTNWYYSINQAVAHRDALAREGASNIRIFGDERSGIAQARKEIAALVQEYQANVSLQASTEGNPLAKDTDPLSFTIHSGQVIQITDKNSVLDTMDLIESEGIIFTDQKGNPISKDSLDLSSNTFYFKVESVGNHQIDLIKEEKEIAGFEQQFVIFSNSDSQDVLRTGKPAYKTQASIQLYCDGSITLIDKIDQDSKASLTGAKLSLYDGDTKIDSWISDGKPYQIAKPLMPGRSYKIVEEDPPIGYYKSDYTFTASPSYKEVFSMPNAKIHMEIIKIDDLGNNYEGADLQLVDKANPDKVLLSWTTTSTPKDISDLVQGGHTYTITETNAPKDVYLNHMDFTVDTPSDPSKMVTISFINNYVNYCLAKVDEEGKHVPGVLIEVFDVTKNDRKVLEWRTGNEPLSVNTFQRGHTYRMVESETVAGKYLSTEKTFTIDEHTPEDQVITITMVNETIDLTLNKVDEEGKNVSGVVLSLIDTTENKVVETFTTTNQPHQVQPELLYAGHHYRLEENVTPDGYYKSEPISFILPTNPPDEPIQITMVDERTKIEIHKVDENGEFVEGVTLEIIDPETNESLGTWKTTKEPIQVKGLTVGKTYTLVESETVAGKYLATSIDFVVQDKQDSIQTITMVDETIRYRIHKVDESGKIIPGVTLELIDLDTNQKVGTWITGENPIELDGVLEAGHSYKLIETEWVAGVHKATDLQFKVESYSPGQVVTITMVDDTANQFTFLKVDDTGTPMDGVSLEIHDIDHNVLYELKSVGSFLGQSKDIHSNPIILTGGETYYLHEVEAPFGYELAEDVVFVVPKERPDTTQIIQMTNRRKPLYLQFLKTDKADSSKVLEDCELTLYSQETNEPLLNMNNEPIKVTTNQNGIATLDTPYLPSGIYAKETKAPKGYQISEEKYEVVVKEDYSFQSNDKILLHVENETVPDTAVRSSLLIYVILALFSSTGLLFLRKKS